MKKFKKKNPNKGILFWVTGLSGSGKTTLAKKIKREIQSLYGPTIVVSGDDIRRIFNFKEYSAKKRFELVMKYCKFSKFITDQNINLIFAVVGMMDDIRTWNKKNIVNYYEIYVKANIKKIIKAKKKKIYHKRNIGEVVGINIKPQFPKNPNTIINNNFKDDINYLSKKLINKIKNDI